MRSQLCSWFIVMLLAGVSCLKRLPRLTASLHHGSGRKLFSSVAAAAPSDQKPIILLDVDGVINSACGLHTTKKELWKDALLAEEVFVDPQHGWFDVAYSPTVVKKINEWSELADIRWLTSWKHRAPEFLAPRLGLKDFPVLSYEEDPTIRDQFRWKVRHAQQLANEVGADRIIMWLDDDLPSFASFVKRNGKVQLYHTTDQENIREHPVLARPNSIYVAPANCLLPEHLDMVDKYLANPELAKGNSIYQYEVKYGEESGTNWVKVFTPDSPAYLEAERILGDDDL